MITKKWAMLQPWGKRWIVENYLRSPKLILKIFFELYRVKSRIFITFESIGITVRRSLCVRAGPPAHTDLFSLSLTSSLEKRGSCLRGHNPLHFRVRAGTPAHDGKFDLCRSTRSACWHAAQRDETMKNGQIRIPRRFKLNRGQFCLKRILIWSPSNLPCGFSIFAVWYFHIYNQLKK